MGNVSHPRTDVVARVVAALRVEGLPVAVGGSAVLASLGLVDRVRDWDVTTEGDDLAVCRALDAAGSPWEFVPGAERPYATAGRYLVQAGDHQVDVLVGFAAWDGDQVVTFPVRATGSWLDLPIADPAVWALAYRLIGRAERAELLRAWLAGSRAGEPGVESRRD